MLTMVFEDTSQLLHRQVTDGRANCFKGSIVWRKYCEVLGGVNSIYKIRAHESTGGSTETGGNGGSGDVLWYGENGIDDMDNTTGKVKILRS